MRVWYALFAVKTYNIRGAMKKHLVLCGAINRVVVYYSNGEMKPQIHERHRKDVLRWDENNFLELAKNWGGLYSFRVGIGYSYQRECKIK